MDHTDIFKHFLLFRGGGRRDFYRGYIFLMSIFLLCFFFCKECVCVTVPALLCVRAASAQLAGRAEAPPQLGVSCAASADRSHPIHATNAATPNSCHNLFSPTSAKVASLMLSPRCIWLLSTDTHDALLYQGCFFLTFMNMGFFPASDSFSPMSSHSY